MAVGRAGRATASFMTACAWLQAPKKEGGEKKKATKPKVRACASLGRGRAEGRAGGLRERGAGGDCGLRGGRACA